MSLTLRGVPGSYLNSPAEARLTYPNKNWPNVSTSRKPYRRSAGGSVGFAARLSMIARAGGEFGARGLRSPLSRPSQLLHDVPPPSRLFHL